MAQDESAIIYLLIGDQLWRMSPEGVLSLVDDDARLPPGAKVLDIDFSHELAGLTPEGAAREAAAAAESGHASRARASDAGAPVLSTSNLADVLAVIYRIGDETIAESGFQTRAFGKDAPLAKGPDSPPPPDLIPPQASITVVMADGGDGWINRYETPSVDLSGVTSNLPVGQLITLVLTDVDGRQLIVTTVDLGGFYRVGGVDLSRLAEGPVTVRASAADPYGNVVNATDDSVKDTLAEVLPDMKTADGADVYLSQAESSRAIISGRVADVQDGQPVDVVISDANGHRVTVNGLVIVNGEWRTAALDLSGFDDGPVFVKASTIDLAGNPAENVATLIKESGALITAAFTDSYVHEGYTGYLNALEGQAETLSGTIDDVENGQRVDVIVTDASGGRVVLSAVTSGAVFDAASGQWQGGGWSIGNANLSSLQPGSLTLTATVKDVAGNEAIATDTIVYDPVALFNNDIVSNRGIGINAAESKDVSFSGTVTGIEAGRTVNVVISGSGSPDLLVTTTVGTDGSWKVSKLDVRAFGDGVLSVSVSATDYAGNAANRTQLFWKDTTALISVQFDDPYIHEGVYTGYLNDAEDNSATVRGTTTGVEPGATVTLTISDVLGATRVITTTVLPDGSYVVGGLDLSGLAEGTLTVKAAVSDLAGNPAQATNTITHDPLAVLNNDITTNRGDVINRFEADSVTTNGTVTNIEAGRTVSVVISDGVKSVSGSAVVDASGKWQLTNTDLSGLADGTLTITATATDRAGNPASRNDVILKDTFALITVEFDNDGDAATAFSGVFNASEVAAVYLRGSVNGVEDGQNVALILTDVLGHTITLTGIVVSGGSWQAPVQDLSSFVPGPIRAEVATVDQAGNPAFDSAAAEIDVAAYIDFDTDYDAVTPGDQGLDIWGIRLGLVTEIKGRSSDIEPGQTVTVHLSDGTVTNDLTALVQADGSWTVAVDTTGLDVYAEWTATVEATDLAGNTAYDALPTMPLSDVLQMSEVALFFFGESDDRGLVQVRGGDAARFGADQHQLDGLTSDGLTTTWAISADGLTLTLTRSDGEAVLVFALSADGTTIASRLLWPLDQDNGSTATLTYVRVEVTQNETYQGAPDTDTVVANIAFAVSDTRPAPFDDEADVVEGQSVSGNVLANDVVVDQPPTVVRINIGGTLVGNTLIGGTNYNVTAGSPAVVGLAQGVLTIRNDGSWTFDAYRNLDHDNPQLAQFYYVARDNDGDVGVAQVTIDVTDGGPGHMSDAYGAFDEGKIGTVQLVDYPFTVTAGSDNLVPSSISFENAGNALLDRLNGMGLTSNGVALVFTLDADNHLVGRAGSDVVLEATLSATLLANGDLAAQGQLRWSRPLDHIGSDVRSLQLPVTATDIDGTPITTGILSMDLDDGVDPIIASGAGVTVDEGGLPPAQSVDGVLNVVVGSDAVALLEFSAIGLQPKLTQNGTVIQYERSPDGQTLTGYIGVTSNAVFRVQLLSTPDAEADSSVPYRFTLYQPFDQLDGNGQHLDTMPLPFVVKVTDGDGDASSTVLDLSIKDGSSPEIIVSGAAMIVAESPRKTLDTHSTKTSQTVQLVAGNDEITDIHLVVSTGGLVKDQGGNTLTQNGEPLVWRDNGDGTVTALTQNSHLAVFRLAVPDHIHINPNTGGSTTVSLFLYGPIDHWTSDEIKLDVPIAVRDADGSSATATITVQINDGRDPELTAVPLLEVDEGGTLGGQTVSDTEAYIRSKGSDALAGSTFAMTSVVTSGGKAVTLAATADGAGWWIATDSDGHEVFRIRLSPAGAAEYQQSRAIDHPPGNGENTLDITFNARLVDADGDLSNLSVVTVRVTDDIPVAENHMFDVTEGADRTAQLLIRAEDVGADGGRITSVTYRGTLYTVAANGSVTFTLTDDSGNRYGVATVYSNGRVDGDIDDTFNLDGALVHDSLTYVVTDADGDAVTSTVNLTVHDFDGRIVIEPVQTLEDTPVVVTLFVDRGDLDAGELVTQIKFDGAQLAGGKLYLDGVALAEDGSGNPYLSQSQLSGNAGTGYVIPAGVLTFVPALNSSQATVNPVLDAAATIDRGGAASDVESSRDAVVVSVADTPLWNGTSQFVYTTNEDDAPVALTLQADLYDTDGSEKLAYRIESIDSGLTLKTGSIIVTNGMALTQAQVNALTAQAAPGLAGQLTFVLVAVATESDNGDTAETARTVSVDVYPVADTPTLALRNVSGTEDVPIDMRELITQSALTDTDGSETLSFRIETPVGWTVTNSGALIAANPANTYSFSAADLSAGHIRLVPAPDVSSHDTAEMPGGTATFTVTAVATESTQDGLAPSPVSASVSKTATVALKGVSDQPLISGDASWTATETGNTGNYTLSGSFDEDERIQLSFLIETEDDQHTEAISLLLWDLPTGLTLVDAGGNPLLLPVVGSKNGKPVYEVKIADLNDVYLQPPKDFSGDLSAFRISQINTEPDGDVARFEHTVSVHLRPVVDTMGGAVLNETRVAEDNPAVVNLRILMADVDGSETITGLTINSNGGGLLRWDGSTISVPVNLATLASANGITLEQLIDSGRLTWVGPQDASGTFDLAAVYEVTDSNGVPAETQVRTLNGMLRMNVEAQVDVGAVDLPDLTRLTTTQSVFTSNGSPIDLAGKVLFTDDDIDGSEYIDRIEIVMPAADGWFVSFPGGTAIHDGLGNWLITLPPGTTSASLQESGKSIFSQLEISSDHITAPTDILIKARVLDGNDAEMIATKVKVEFTAPVSGGTATAVGSLNPTIIDGQEGTLPIDVSGHINTAAAGDANDIVSFRVMASDLPYGLTLQGSGMQYKYDSTGKTVIEYVFPQSTLVSLALGGLNDDFAGVITFPIYKVSTDPSGDTVVTNEVLRVEVSPVVDTPNALPDFTMREDVPTSLSVPLTGIIADTLNAPDQGKEVVTQIHFLSLAGGSLSAPPGVLVSDGGTGYYLNDLSRLSEVVYTPPLNISDQISLPIELTVTDTTTGVTVVSSSDTQTFASSINILIKPVTDYAVVSASTSQGDEDTDIALTGLNASLYDNNGNISTESLSVQITGVPAGAVIFVNHSGTLVQAINNGSNDGGLTYSWGLDPVDLANAVLRPPLNFAGDIRLTLQATTAESGAPTDIKHAYASFLVGVHPVADGIQITRPSPDLTAREGDSVTISLGAEVQEQPVNSEGVLVTVFIDGTTSDASALVDLLTQGEIRVGLLSASITTATGGYDASILIPNTLLADGVSPKTILESLVLTTGANAFGHLDVRVDVASYDEATVLGARDFSISPEASLSLGIDLTPTATPPVLVADYDGLAFARDVAGVPLGLTLTPVNPAPGEVAELVINGLPADFTLNHGSRVGTDWVVDAADVGSLAFATLGGADSLDLQLTPRSTLDGVTVNGSTDEVVVSLSPVGGNTLLGTSGNDWLAGGSGDDMLSGGAGSDVFVFRSADGNTPAAVDQITDFSKGDDALDVTGLLSGVVDGVTADAQVDLSESGGTTTLSFKPDGSNVIQQVVLQNVSLDDLYGGSTSGVSEAAILQKMIDDHTLVTQ
ncbi:Ig-like domain-containing protein [Chitinibacteraceae bacterium HSL-7]